MQTRARADHGGFAGFTPALQSILVTRKDPKWISISGPFVRRLVSRKLPFSLLQTFERGTHGVDDLVVRHHDGFVAGEHHRVLVHHLYIVA